MKKFLFFIALLLSLTCAMRNWQFNFGFRIFIFNLFEIVFIIGFVIQSLWKKIYLISKKQYQLVNLLILWLAIVLLSDIFALVFPLNEYSINQSIKGILIQILDVTFFISFILYFNDITIAQQKKIIKYFIIGVIISALYSFVQFYSLKQLGFNIDSLIWPAVSYNYIFAEKTLKFDMIYRLTGVTGGANAQAIYIFLVLPILTYHFFLDRTVKKFLLLMILYSALFLTLSRSALLALFLIFFLFIFNALKKNKKSSLAIGSLFLFLIPFFLFAYYYWKDIQIILQSRQFFEDSNRTKIYERALNMFMKYPLGVGYNNYSAYRLFMFGYYSQPNSHNSWLTILAENGIQGILFYFYYFYFLLKSTYKANSYISIPYRYSLLGIMVAITFNNTFSLFFVQYFIILFFLYMINANLPNKLVTNSSNNTHHILKS